MRKHGHTWSLWASVSTWRTRSTSEIRNLATSQKFRDVERNARVAFVIDDTTPDDESEFKAGVGRGIEIRGCAEALREQELPSLAPPGFFSREVIRIHPERARSWHVDPHRPRLEVLRGKRL
jgi:hypothetical protein